MSKPIIFLDMDGVIADFVTAAHRAHNRNVTGSHAHLPTLWGISNDEFWTVINNTPRFWDDLEKTSEADELIKMLWEQSDLFILSSPSKNPQAYLSKLLWIKRHFPFFPVNKVILTKHKWLLSQPDRLLIDDLAHNLGQWIESGGGQTYWWNPRIDQDKRIAQFKEWFSLYVRKFKTTRL